MSDVILYNPKKYNNKPCPPVPNQFNPDKTQKNIILPVGTFEPMLPNQLKRYPSHVANEIVKRWGFVRVVQPEQLDAIKKEMEQKDFSCDVVGCGYETDNEKALNMHKVRKHKISEDLRKTIDEIPVAQPKGVSAAVVRVVDGIEYSPEGIPAGGTPKNPIDGYYGPGEEDLTNSMRITRPGAPGVF